VTGGAAPVLAVDGPGGSGKGTVCRAVADRLGWHLLDSGALYRLVAIAAERRGIALDDHEALAAVAGGLDVAFEPASDDTRALLAGEDVTGELRAETTGNKASIVAAVPAVRAALVDRQRAFRQPPGLVADGRDMGSVIFPDAEAKVFLTASARERARRRHKQLLEKGIDANLERLYTEIAERDRRDSERVVAPLRPAEDAYHLDTTGMSIPEVVDAVVDFLEGRLASAEA
jgi:cytidylate kinase